MFCSGNVHEYQRRWNRGGNAGARPRITQTAWAEVSFPIGQKSLTRSEKLIVVNLI